MLLHGYWRSAKNLFWQIKLPHITQKHCFGKSKKNVATDGTEALFWFSFIAVVIFYCTKKITTDKTETFFGKSKKDVATDGTEALFWFLFIAVVIFYCTKKITTDNTETFFGKSKKNVATDSTEALFVFFICSCGFYFI